MEITRWDQLLTLSDHLKKSFEKKHEIALRNARKNGWTIQGSTAEEKRIALRELDKSGKPVYFLSGNLTAAKTVSANKVWTGGGSGLSLSGQGVVLREWDESAVRPTHQEMTGRVIQGDGASSFSLHSTHVAGTMIAGGVVNNAHGMACQASLRAFDWFNDYSEMADEAADGALLSNSSYIYITGWYHNGTDWYWYGDPSISTSEDYGFGFYSSSSAIVDSITYYAPYYLPCKAAGNDRGEGPAAQPVSHYEWNGTAWVLTTAYKNPDGMPSGFDCIASGWGVSKNVLTVGAVTGIPSGYSSPSDVILASFSGTGPADDGRIKPDIVADGIGLYSTSSTGNSSYTTMSGTSMATPNVTGSLALLQEHYHNLHGNYIKAATLKGLAIHTADEAGGSPGPDYQFGWGLLNINKAALLSGNTTTAQINELSLSNGMTFSMNIKSNGTEPLKATICWTDPSGTPPPDGLDPATPMLVNDLDLRIDGVTYKPWTLDPANPQSGAVPGDNIRDNTEQILISNPGSGCHTLTVSHKGTLTGGSQMFSLILSGVTLYPQFVTGTISGNQTICENTLPALLTGTSPTGGIAPYSFQWQDSPDSITFTDIPGATGINYQPGPLSSTHFYRQKQLSSGSCTSGFSNTIRIFVNEFTVLTITGNNSVCVNSGNYTYSSETGMTSYLWTLTPGGVLVSGQGTNTIMVAWTSAGSNNVSLSYTDQHGCNPPAPASLPVTVQPLPAPSGTISGPSEVCDQTTGVLYSVQPVENAISYIWSVPQGCSIISGQLSDSVYVEFPSGASSGIISVYGNNLCGDGIPSPDLPVQVSPGPPAPVIWQVGDSLMSDAPEGNQWWDETGIIPGATSNIFIPVMNGRYRDVVTVEGCSSPPSEWINFVVSSIPLRNAIPELNVFPNPAGKEFAILLTLPFSCQLIVEMTSVSGKIVLRKNWDYQPGRSNTLVIHCPEISPGFYFLIVRLESGTLFSKVLIK